MGKIFFIADTHFEDKDVFEMSGEKEFFTSIEEKDNIIVERWNKVVTPEDTVFILGDFGNIDYWCLLNGKKILIKGNHDIAKHCDVIYPIIYENFFMLSHEPMWVSEDSPYANIFGHVHNNPIYKTVSSRSYCVCACRNKYTPVEFETIKEAMRNA